MKNSLFLFLTLILVAGPATGCALGRRPAKKPPVVKQAPLFVGTVSVVNEEQCFVLIDSGAQPSPAPGAVLKTQPTEGAPAELKAGEIRRRPFVIADVVAGLPKVGDRVYQQPK